MSRFFSINLVQISSLCVYTVWFIYLHSLQFIDAVGLLSVVGKQLIAHEFSDSSLGRQLMHFGVTVVFCKGILDIYFIPHDLHKRIDTLFNFIDKYVLCAVIDIVKINYASII